MLRNHNLLHISLEIHDEPSKSLGEALSDSVKDYSKINWPDIIGRRNGINILENEIKRVITQKNISLVFMQLQSASIISFDLAKWMKERAFVINWTGDVRENIDWYAHLAPYINLTLFTNTTDVEQMRAWNLQADYLQVGYDERIYCKNDVKGNTQDIVFLGNNYTNHFPLSKHRQEMVTFLKRTYGERFAVYGTGWHETKTVATRDMERLIYNNCKVAINQNHFNHKRFSSDRIFRIMGCGAMCLSNYFPDAEMEFTANENISFWQDFDELKNKIDFFLKEETVRKNIAENGRQLVLNTATWEARIKQLDSLLFKYIFETKDNTITKTDSWINDLKYVSKFKKYGQIHDEGYIAYILSKVGKDKFLVELGAGDGVALSNTRLLIEEGYKAILLDGDNKGNADVSQEWITADNVCDLLAKHNCPKEFDFLNIDLDGNDYYILDNILKQYKPRLIVAEINGYFPENESIVMKRNDSHAWDGTYYYGMSLGATKKLAEQNGYTVIFQTDSLNAYLLRNDLILEGTKINLNFNPAYNLPYKPNSEWIQV